MTIYLDNAATSYPKPLKTFQAMQRFHEKVGANPGRSGHRDSIEAGRILYETRENIAELFGVSDPLNIAFTLNATMALNMAMMGILTEADHVITSGIEHNSVARPLRWLEENDIKVTRIACDPVTAELDPTDVKKAITPKTKMVVLTHGSNVCGTLFPLSEVGQITRENDILFLVDSAQTAGSYPIDVEMQSIDLLAFSGHKSLFGPQGTGGLYVRPGLKVEPLLRGGTGSRSEEDIQPDFMPDILESGTPNTVGLAGLGAGVRFVMNEGVDKIAAHKTHLVKRLLMGLKSIDGITMYGREDELDRISVVSLNIRGMMCSDVGQRLDEDYDILVRCGLHCAPWAHRTLGTYPEGAVRLSPGYFNTDEDIDTVVSALSEIAKDAR